MTIPRPALRFAAPLAAVALLAVATPAAHAQHDHAPATSPDATPPALGPEAQAFLERVRAGTARFRDRDEAVAEGYRMLGPDMPNMGEHWIHPGRAVSGQIDPERPPVLTYLTLGGQAVLTGAAFTVPVRAGDTPPPFAFAPWHFHSTDLDRESYGLVGHGAFHGDEAAGTTRLAMIHAWVGLDNPEGPFGDDHWGLAFARHGLVPPVPAADVPLREAAQALFLASDAGVPFFTRMFALLDTTPDEQARLATVLSGGRQAVQGHLGHLRGAGRAVDAPGVAMLARAWRQVRADAEAVIGPDRLATLHLF